MTAEQQLAELRRIAEQAPRTGIRMAMQEVTQREATIAKTEQLRAENGRLRAAVLMMTNAGMTEGLC